MKPSSNPNYYFNAKYKSKFICVFCRKVFKRTLLTDIGKGEAKAEKPAKCPQCGRATLWIGPKFRAPKAEDSKAWNSISMLKEIGVLHFFGWASDGIEIPRTARSLTETLKAIKQEWDIAIRQWTSAEYSPENKSQIKYFADRIKKIEQYLSRA